jgi:hypothetical protein
MYRNTTRVSIQRCGLLCCTAHPWLLVAKQRTHRLLWGQVSSSLPINLVARSLKYCKLRLLKINWAPAVIQKFEIENQKKTNPVVKNKLALPMKNADRIHDTPEKTRNSVNHSIPLHSVHELEMKEMEQNTDLAHFVELPLQGFVF